MNNTKIVIQDNEIYLTFSSSMYKVVNSGAVYIGQETNDPLINHYIEEFDSKYAMARKVMLSDGKIVFEKRGISNIVSIIKSYDTKDWVNLILGAILGTLLGLYTWLFN